MPALEIQTNIPLINTILGDNVLWKLMAPTAAKDRLGTRKMMGVTKEVAGERFGPDAKVRNEMLGA
jgi:hypothetical protein